MMRMAGTSEVARARARGTTHLRREVAATLAALVRPVCQVRALATCKIAERRVERSVTPRVSEHACGHVYPENWTRPPACMRCRGPRDGPGAPDPSARPCGRALRSWPSESAWTRLAGCPCG